jgi:preprotein translocase subunit SecG
VLQSVIVFVHAVLALAIIGVVLMQKGKGADAGAGFGSGASGTVFGARGSATFLSKTTAVLATLFFVTSLSLAYMAANRPKAAVDSVLDKAAPVSPAPVSSVPLSLPVVPAPVAPAPAAPAAP